MSLMSKIKHRTMPLVAASVVAAGTGNADAQERPLYLDGAQPVGVRVEDLLARLTLEEKVSLVHADSPFSVSGVPRLGISELRMDDGPMGVREEGASWQHVDDFSTAMPATLGLAATWNPDLAAAYGAVIGQEGAAARQGHHAGAKPQHPAHSLVRP